MKHKKLSEWNKYCDEPEREDCAACKFVDGCEGTYRIPAPIAAATDAVVQALRTALKYSWHPTLNVKTTAIKSIAVAMLKECEEDREKAQAALDALNKEAPDDPLR